MGMTLWQEYESITADKGKEGFFRTARNDLPAQHGDPVAGASGHKMIFDAANRQSYC